MIGSEAKKQKSDERIGHKIEQAIMTEGSDYSEDGGGDLRMQWFKSRSTECTRDLAKLNRAQIEKAKTSSRSKASAFLDWEEKKK